jgi:endonuclease/exonuclease/phosphatase family metal-dependent hydrolase
MIHPGFPDCLSFGLIAGVLLTSLTVHSQPLRVMSYNIRFDNPADGLNAWPNRKSFLVDQVRLLSPDILGVQEALPSQCEYLAAELAGYGQAGIGRDENGTGESVNIFFRLERFTLIESQTFWLSETPDVPSIGWDAAIRRICTFIRLIDRESGASLMVLNTHFDHVGEQARRKSADLILRKINGIVRKSEPVILLGDFNAEPESEPLTVLKRELREARLVAANVDLPQPGSFNAFDASKRAEKLIDHIFVSNDLSVDRYAMPVDTKEDRYPSDHFPVVADLQWPLEKR